MSHDDPAPDSLEELRRLGEHVRDLSSELPGEAHDVTEIVATRQGSLSPYGDETEFPWKKTSYIHPRTVINR